MEVSSMVELSPTGEIASFLDVNQFQPGRTQFACGFFACAIVKSMSRVGQQPTQTAQEMIAEAEQWYAQFDGDNSMRNMDGMTGCFRQIRTRFPCCSSKGQDALCP